MLLCDIASLSRLSITIVSLNGFPRLKNKTKECRKKPRLQVALYHSKENVKGKERPVQNGYADVGADSLQLSSSYRFLDWEAGPFAP